MALLAEEVLLSSSRPGLPPHSIVVPAVLVPIWVGQRENVDVVGLQLLSELVSPLEHPVDHVRDGCRTDLDSVTVSLFVFYISFDK